MVLQPITTIDQLKKVKAFLADVGLPHTDLSLRDTRILGFFRNEELLATAAVELHEGYWLLRSVAVVKWLRGQQVGQTLVRHLLSLPEVTASQGVYLLTETARDFFHALGFREIHRAQAPRAISASQEFSAVCPQSAIAMKYSLLL
ncbi:MAG: arsenic resistance N-acetyltransferase ArsN2 [Cyclobacteriaceae bacterium]|jgi:amino-acid N-acetyltransferase|nr:arsenic resistance N-acetyltransferase ArsN2 [Cyclobacteriaceae bacterium]